MGSFLGFDHVDCRVRSLAAVESFYDGLMPRLGLAEKRYASVDGSGEWHDAAGAYNAVEYYEPAEPGRPRRFIGFIESPLHRSNDTRIAFRVRRADLEELAAVAIELGAQNVEWNDDMAAYPAFFFEDPAGTKLEFIGRNVT